MSVLIKNARISIARMFIPAYEDFCESRLLSDEPIFAAVNCAHWDTFGFYVITSYRAFMVLYEADRRRKRIHYRTGEPKGSVGVRAKMQWYPDIDTDEYLTSRELARPYVDEYRLSDIPNHYPAKYACEYRGKQFLLTELSIEGQDYTFARDDGRYVYELIQKAIRAGGRLEQVTEPVAQETSKESHTPTELLAQLVSLRDADILTQTEFEAAKAKILKRL